jgi:hypothetical protein
MLGLVGAPNQKPADRPKGRLTRPHIEHLLDVAVAGRWILQPDLLIGCQITENSGSGKPLKLSDLLAGSL